MAVYTIELREQPTQRQSEKSPLSPKGEGTPALFGLPVEAILVHNQARGRRFFLCVFFEPCGAPVLRPLVGAIYDAFSWLNSRGMSSLGKYSHAGPLWVPLWLTVITRHVDVMASRRKSHRGCKPLICNRLYHFFSMGQIRFWKNSCRTTKDSASLLLREIDSAAIVRRTPDGG